MTTKTRLVQQLNRERKYGNIKITVGFYKFYNTEKKRGVSLLYVFHVLLWLMEGGSGLVNTKPEET